MNSSAVSAVPKGALKVTKSIVNLWKKLFRVFLQFIFGETANFTVCCHN